jgi:glycosyltransferase involved in cell wall biosynthesis
MTESGAGIHQILVAASPGDAITNLAFALRDLLRRIGPSEIYARHIDPSLHENVYALHRYESRADPRNLLLFHASIGQSDLHNFLIARPEPLVLVYHNITPAKYFAPYDPNFAALLERGRFEVERLRPRVIGAIADSAYNAKELEAMGYRDVRVVPPVVGIHRLSEVEPRASTEHHLTHLDAPIVLSVGQLMPHKRPDFLIEAMHIAETYHAMRNFLLLVGHHRLPRYTRAIKEQIRELGVLGVHVVGAVDEPELAATFRAASVVVTASEHEGFCLPLVEAMSFGKPVVARACAAVPETVGNAAMLVPQEQGPALFAEVVGEVVSNATLRDELAARSRSRLAELEGQRPGAEMVAALLEVV